MTRSKGFLVRNVGKWLRSSALLVATAASMPLLGQNYDLLLKGGHVIDPANQIDGVRDVAVSDGTIARVAEDIPSSEADKVVDVSGHYVTPGLIDIHFHTYGYSGGIFPDDTALLTGTTTVVDAGGPGWRTFEDFKKKIVDRAKTRVLALLHIAGGGMVSEAERNLDDMDPQATAAKIKQHPEILVGVKTAHYPHQGWGAIKRAVEAGRLSNTPVMVDDKIFTNTGRTSREKLLDVMRPGDIHTHMYNDRQVEIINRFSGEVQEYARQARRRGVLFDLGHGGGSFVWPVASKAMKGDFPPDTISTDLHQSSIMSSKSDMPNCITKMMHLGMSLQDAIARSTVAPARAIQRFPELGTLSEGKAADIAVLRLEHGIFALADAWTKKALAAERLEALMTIRAGKVVFDREGLAYPIWQQAGEYKTIP